MRVFVGGGSKSGDMCVTEEEWPTFRDRMKLACAQLIDETDNRG